MVVDILTKQPFKIFLKMNTNINCLFQSDITNSFFSCKKQEFTPLTTAPVGLGVKHGQRIQLTNSFTIVPTVPCQRGSLLQVDAQ